MGTHTHTHTDTQTHRHTETQRPIHNYKKTHDKTCIGLDTNVLLLSPLHVASAPLIPSSRRPCPEERDLVVSMILVQLLAEPPRRSKRGIWDMLSERHQCLVAVPPPRRIRPTHSLLSSPLSRRARLGREYDPGTITRRAATALEARDLGHAVRATPMSCCCPPSTSHPPHSFPPLVALVQKSETWS